MGNGPGAQATVEPGQRTRVELSLGNPDFCQIQPAILFDTASSFVASLPDHKSAYQLVLQRLNAGGQRLLVVGHTDKVGGSAANRSLSERRARAALAVLTGNTAEWETSFRIERWGDGDVRTMLTEVGLPTDNATVRQHKDLSQAGEQRRELLFHQYFARLLRQPVSPPVAASTSPATLGCGEQHVLGPGDHRESRRAEFFFFLGTGAPALTCSVYPTWRNPCGPLPLPSTATNVFFVAGHGNDASGDGSRSKPWLTITHALAQIATLQRARQPATLHVLGGAYAENITLTSGITLEGGASPLPEVRGTSDAPVIHITGARNCTVRALRIVQGQRSGIRIERSQEITISGCQIIDNFAPRGGGVAIVDANTVSVEENVIERNTAGNIAIAVTHLDLDVRPAFTRRGFRVTTFEMSVGDGHGGGVYLQNSGDVRVRSNVIRDNRAILFGGGIAVDNTPGFDNSIEIHTNEIVCNQVSHGSTVAVTGCSVADMGDPVLDRLKEETIDAAAEGAVPLLHGVGIESGLGGGIALRHVSPRTRLIENWIGVRRGTTVPPPQAQALPNCARRGGGIECFVGAYPHIEGNRIVFNLASDDGGGIAIDQFDPFLPTSQPRFFGFRRSAISPRQTIRLQENVIVANECGEDGGGVYATGNAQVEVGGSGTLIAANAAGENGGGVRVSYGTRLRAKQVKLIGNQANTKRAGSNGGGGLAARNSIVELEDCELRLNTSTRFAGGAIYCNSTFEGGYDASGLLENKPGQFDDIMDHDFGFGTRTYRFVNCRGNDNLAIGPSGAGGFLYVVRDPGFEDGFPVGGIFPLIASIEGAGTAIGLNGSDYDNLDNLGGARQKRGNVVIDLSGNPEDRAFITADVPSVVAKGIVHSMPPPDNYPVVIIRGPGLPTHHPKTFPFPSH